MTKPTLKRAAAPSRADDTPHPVITVSVGGLEYLRLDGARAHVLVAPFGDQTRIAEALARAIGVFLAHQPALAPLATAADAVEKLAAAAAPHVARDGLMAVAGAITEFRDRIEADAGHRTTH